MKLRPPLPIFILWGIISGEKWRNIYLSALAASLEAYAGMGCRDRLRKGKLRRHDDDGESRCEKIFGGKVNLLISKHHRC
jgi:hypothetical protein